MSAKGWLIFISQLHNDEEEERLLSLHLNRLHVHS